MTTAGMPSLFRFRQALCDEPLAYPPPLHRHIHGDGAEGRNLETAASLIYKP